jgi:hypothetical protein
MQNSEYTAEPPLLDTRLRTPCLCGAGQRQQSKVHLANATVKINQMQKSK